MIRETTASGQGRSERAYATCRSCGARLSVTFADLGMSPPANAFLDQGALTQMEAFYPLHALVCSVCLLVQVEQFEAPGEIFSDYAYFSSYSSSWLAHCRAYSLSIAERLNLDASSQVVEIASNDGYLLKNFKELGIPILGIEPAANVARVAIEAGIPTVVDFFGLGTAEVVKARVGQADLIVGNNVLAHVPNVNDFVAGIKVLLKPSGTATFEFPHLLRLIESNQFDTIYHEHFSYFSLLAVSKIFERAGLQVIDVDEVPTHGGSLRLHVRHGSSTVASENVARVLFDERAAALDRLETYSLFAHAVERTKRELLSFLISAKTQGKRIAAYGAAAKGTTLLNYCGVRTDFIDFIVDKNPHKQGRFLPGCHIPIYSAEKLAETKPDYVLILPWNLRDEIVAEMAHIRDWGGRFVTPIPSVALC